MSASEPSVLLEELEVLEAIYIHELEVVKTGSNDVSSVILQLHPATGEDVDQRYVCMTLQLDPPLTYPDEPPEILIKNPRGMGEEEVHSLLEAMHYLCAERVGGPMLFELIELAKESLTAGNIPHCPCMICLEHFHEGEAFTRTHCYHYFHEQCLARYVKHCLATKTDDVKQTPTLYTKTEQKKQIVCPVCREGITTDKDLLSVHTPVEEKLVFEFSDELRALQSRMAALFEKQRANGSIIDVEAEKNKYLVQKDDIVYLPSDQTTDGICDKTDLDSTSTKQSRPIPVPPENLRNQDRNRHRKNNDYNKNYDRDRRNYELDKGRGGRGTEKENSDGELKNQRSGRYERNATYRSERDRDMVQKDYRMKSHKNGTCDDFSAPNEADRRSNYGTGRSSGVFSKGGSVSERSRSYPNFENRQWKEADRSTDRPRSGGGAKQTRDNTRPDSSNKQVNLEKVTGTAVNDAADSIDVKDRDDKAGATVDDGGKLPIKTESEVNDRSEGGELEERSKREKYKRERNEPDNKQFRSEANGRLSDRSCKSGLEVERSHLEEVNSGMKNEQNTERPQSGLGRGKNRDNKRHDISSANVNTAFGAQKENNDSTCDKSVARPKSGVGRERQRDNHSHASDRPNKEYRNRTDVSRKTNERMEMKNRNKDPTVTSELKAEVAKDKTEDNMTSIRARTNQKHDSESRIADRSHTGNSRSGYRDDQHARKMANYERNNYDRHNNYGKENDRSNWRDHTAKAGVRSMHADDESTFDPYHNDDYEEEQGQMRKENTSRKLGHGRGRPRPRGRRKEHDSGNPSLSARSREMSGPQRSQAASTSGIRDKDCDKYAYVDLQTKYASTTDNRNNYDNCKNKSDRKAVVEKIDCKVDRSDNGSTDTAVTVCDNASRKGPPGFKLKPPPGLCGATRKDDKIVSLPPGF